MSRPRQRVTEISILQIHGYLQNITAKTETTLQEESAETLARAEIDILSRVCLIPREPYWMTAVFFALLYASFFLL